MNKQIRPVAVLFAICLVASALLGFVHNVTAPVAAAIAEERMHATYAELMPTAANFEERDCDVEGCTAALEAIDQSGNTVGYVVVAQSKGYGGQVPLAVSFSTDGKVVNAAVLANEETPGLGSRVAEDPYLGQYLELEAVPRSVEEADLISGATISSKAVLNAFNAAVEAYGVISS